MLALSTWRKKPFSPSSSEIAFSVIWARLGCVDGTLSLGSHRTAGSSPPVRVAFGPTQLTGRFPSAKRPSSGDFWSAVSTAASESASSTSWKPRRSACSSSVMPAYSPDAASSSSRISKPPPRVTSGRVWSICSVIEPGPPFSRAESGQVSEVSSGPWQERAGTCAIRAAGVASWMADVVTLPVRRPFLFACSSSVGRGSSSTSTPTAPSCVLVPVAQAVAVAAESAT
jgi:hypothetical protein